MTWLANQFDEEPWPDKPPLFGNLRWTFNDHNPPPLFPPGTRIRIQESARQAGKEFQVMAQQVNGVFTLMPVPEEKPKPDPAPRSKYRENPPRFSPPNHIYDRRGRKRY